MDFHSLFAAASFTLAACKTFARENSSASTFPREALPARAAGMSPLILLGNSCAGTLQSRSEGAEVAASSGRGGTGLTGLLGAANRGGTERERGGAA